MRPVYVDLPIAYGRIAQNQGPRGLLIFDRVAANQWNVGLHYSHAVRVASAQKLGQTARRFNRLKQASKAADEATLKAQQAAASAGRRNCPKVQASAERAATARQRLEEKRQEGLDAEKQYHQAKAQFRQEREEARLRELIERLILEDE